MIIEIVLRDSRFDGAPSGLVGSLWRSNFAAELVRSVVLECRPKTVEVTFGRDAVRHAVTVVGMIDHARWKVEDDVLLILSYLDEETERWMWMPDEE